MNVGITHLRAFLAVLDSGSFSGAADELGISQSAVSHSVAALERSLGTSVLVRTGRPRPTAFGEQILAPARQAVAAHAAICELTARRNRQPSGTVRMAAPPTACQGILPTLLARWQEAFPRLNVVLLEGDDSEVEEWLRCGAVELSVLVGRPSKQGVLLSTDTFQALLRRDHPLAAESRIDVADLDDDPLIVSTGGCEKYVRQAYRLARRPLPEGHRVRDMGTLLSMVRSGIGVSVVPGLTATMLDHQLVMVPLAQTVTRSLTLTGPLDRPWHPLAEILASWCRQHLVTGQDTGAISAAIPAGGALPVRTRPVASRSAACARTERLVVSGVSQAPTV
ncbi:LysR family transcriptional regulator [Streptomyces nogalater]|uniref:LysR family transcriptional regulator n=1 Tax=Streptomyces nogalater TaxID=38314 RepID=A0ABW0WFV2_STRNO